MNAANDAGAANGGMAVCNVEPTPAGLPSFAVAPAATGAGGLNSADDGLLVLELVGARKPTDADFERLVRARKTLEQLQPILALPDRHKGRRAMTQEVARSLGLSVAQVYRLIERAQGGIVALARSGLRADRGARRCLIGAQWEQWCAAAIAAQPQLQDAAELSQRMRDCVRSAWVGGAPSARQAWLKACAVLGRELMRDGCPQHLIAQLLQLACPRRWVEDEGQHFRVAGRNLRDAKGVYDNHLTPVRRSAAGYMPGDLVCGDISPLDIPVLREDGSTAYGRMISWHDVATNWLWIDLYLVTMNEGVRREHVAASFARMCERAPFGAPKRLYLDNGSEYKWEHMLFAWSQLAELTGQAFAADEAALLPESGRLVRSIPFRPRGKRIEGQFGNLHHWLGWWLGYVGGNRMTKKVANLGHAPAPSNFYEVQQWLANELADYHVTPQPGAEHMAGLSPQQKIDACMQAGWKPARIEREALMLAFADRDTRVVDRGAINFGSRTWTADFLMGVHGRVTVACPRIAAPEFDCLFVWGRDGRFLGVAAPERVFGVLDAAGAQEADRRRRTLKLLMADKVKEAGGPLDVRETAGFRAQVLGLDATLARADAAAVQVELSDEMRRMAQARAQLADSTLALMRRADAAKDAQKLARLVFETEDEAAARAMGF